ncbi:NPC intracellular cholesterol transporter 2 isoform 2-T2 [Discoglossus pictus]
MMSLGRVVFLLSLAVSVLPAILAEPLVYKDCGCQTGKLINVDISPCPDQPCHLVKGGTYTINVTFTSEEDADSSLAQLYGVTTVIHVMFHIPEGDGCKSVIILSHQEEVDVHLPYQDAHQDRLPWCKYLPK